MKLKSIQKQDNNEDNTKDHENMYTTSYLLKPRRPKSSKKVFSTLKIRENKILAEINSNDQPIEENSNNAIEIKGLYENSEFSHLGRDQMAKIIYNPLFNLIKQIKEQIPLNQRQETVS